MCTSTHRRNIRAGTRRYRQHCTYSDIPTSRHPPRGILPGTLTILLCHWRTGNSACVANWSSCSPKRSYAFLRHASSRQIRASSVPLRTVHTSRLIAGGAAARPRVTPDVCSTPAFPLHLRWQPRIGAARTRQPRPVTCINTRSGTQDSLFWQHRVCLFVGLRIASGGWLRYAGSCALAGSATGRCWRQHAECNNKNKESRICCAMPNLHRIVYTFYLGYQ
jgi:hypothetical protein